MHTPVLKKLYQEQVVPELKKKLGVTNPHQVPALTKVVINSAYRADTDKNLQAEILKEISKIAGQKPVVTHARKSVSNFKVRQGMPLGVMVTLRGAAMYEFLARLIYVALPMQSLPYPVLSGIKQSFTRQRKLPGLDRRKSPLGLSDGILQSAARIICSL